MRSAVICSSLIQEGGGAWSTADLYSPLILLNALQGRGGYQSKSAWLLCLPSPPAAAYPHSTPPESVVQYVIPSSSTIKFPSLNRLSCQWVSKSPLRSTSCDALPFCTDLAWRATTQQIYFPPASLSDVLVVGAGVVSVAQGSVSARLGRKITYTHSANINFSNHSR